MAVSVTYPPGPVLAAFGLDAGLAQFTPLGYGLINHTWKITGDEGIYVLQQVNAAVFKDPGAIADNLVFIGAWLREQVPDYYLPLPLPTLAGKTLLKDEQGGYYRLLPFVKNSITKQVVETANQAYEAALQFGRFTRLLSGLDIRQLKTTIPSFHDLTLRYEQFTRSLATGNPERIRECQVLIRQLTGWSDIATTYEKIKKDPAFRLRVTHHDTKISNVLFNPAGKGICVIDLDTVMPGYFISDLGDMMRTYLSPVDEEVADTSRICIREDFYQGLVQGYQDEMKDELNVTEKKFFPYAGLFIIYMQAIRFLTDYLNDDIYYGAKYPGHNLVRATNQAVLLEQFRSRHPPDSR